MTTSVTLEVEGLGLAMKELGRVDADLKKAINREIYAALKAVQADARARVPATMPRSFFWPTGNLAWSKKAKTGIQIRAGAKATKDGGTRVAALRQTNPAGAVYEMAGRRSAGKTDAGRRLVADLNKHGRPGRALWAAVDAAQDELRTTFVGIVEKVATATSRELR